MPGVEDRVKQIIVDQLGVDAGDVPQHPPSSTILEQILWTGWN